MSLCPHSRHLKDQDCIPCEIAAEAFYIYALEEHARQQLLHEEQELIAISIFALASFDAEEALNSRI